jgi:hypothetical protein
MPDPRPSGTFERRYFRRTRFKGADSYCPAMAGKLLIAHPAAVVCNTVLFLPVTFRSQLSISQGKKITAYSKHHPFVIFTFLTKLPDRFWTIPDARQNEIL